ncbi:MAG TPA: hypothetical protein VEY09_04860 [Pyrinomonadaceae bacterium]|nr:hypothetical protein [Pyrinomonadaceae bacterium]
MYEHNERYLPGNDNERRSLRRVAPTSKVWAAVENTTRNEMLGMAEVSDFSGLGISLRNIAGDPVAAVGDKFCVTLVAEEGIIPLSGTLVHLDQAGRLGLRLDSPEPPGQQFLIRVYQRASAAVHAD